MAATDRKLYDIEIRVLQEADFPAAARLHRICFPDKIESLLGDSCIIDTYHERFSGAAADSYALVAIHRRDGRLAGYIYASDMGPEPFWAHAFVGRTTIRRQMRSRAWRTPAVWAWLLKRVWRKLFARDLNEGDVVQMPPHTTVAKMLAVDPDFRFGNVGIDLMLEIESEARRRGARRLAGLVEHRNRKAERLYNSIGWVRTTPATEKYTVFSMHKDLI